MLTEFDRPMTEMERARLLGQLPAGCSRQAVLSGLREAICLVAIFALLAVMKNLIAAGLGAALYALWLLVGYAKARHDARQGDPTAERRRDLAKAAILAATTARVQRVESSAVVEVLGDLVTIYLFDLGDGRVFWHGVLFEDNIDPARWPSTCFELVHVEGSQEVFGPFCEGERLTPRETLDRVDFGDLPESGIVGCSLDEFVRSVTKKVAR